MNKRLFLSFAALAVLLAVIIPFWAFSSSGSSSSSEESVASSEEPAKQIFQDNCGLCHSLAAAGSDGVIGPNLDDLLGGLPDQESRVEAAIVNGIEGRMPAGILTGPDVTLVSNFVAEEAGR
jgi:cytochrome c6